MLSKAKIKLLNQLNRKKYRELHNMFFVEGSRNVLDFLHSDCSFIELFATNDWIQNHKLDIPKGDTSLVSKKELKKVSALTTASDVLAIFELPNTSFNGNIITDNLTIALDNISDPGNLGTIIRTADWYGINQIYCSKNTVDAFNPKVVQATMGSLARVNVTYTELDKLFATKPEALKIFGAALNGTPITNLKPQTNGIILIGSEAHGISPELIDYITDKITIPLYNKNLAHHPESLNASIANAIICHTLKIKN